jgi:hypothetical protein
MLPQNISIIFQLEASTKELAKLRKKYNKENNV